MQVKRAMMLIVLQIFRKARYKARIVAKGYNQVLGANFTDVFSLVMKHSSIRALLGIMVIQNLELKQLDVKTMFLHGELDKDIDMQQLEDFEKVGKKDHLCLLKKSLYDLKQSSWQWYKLFDSFMIKHNFDRCSYDNCVSFKRNRIESFIYLLLYVDDMLVVSKDKDEIRRLKA